MNKPDSADKDAGWRERFRRLWNTCSGYCDLFETDWSYERGSGVPSEQVGRCYHQYRKPYPEEVGHTSPQACSRCDPLACACPCHISSAGHA